MFVCFLGRVGARGGGRGVHGAWGVGKGDKPKVVQVTKFKTHLANELRSTEPDALLRNCWPEVMAIRTLCKNQQGPIFPSMAPASEVSESFFIWHSDQTSLVEFAGFCN